MNKSNVLRNQDGGAWYELPRAKNTQKSKFAPQYNTIRKTNISPLANVSYVEESPRYANNDGRRLISIDQSLDKIRISSAISIGSYITNDNSNNTKPQLANNYQNEPKINSKNESTEKYGYNSNMNENYGNINAYDENMRQNVYAANKVYPDDKNQDKIPMSKRTIKIQNENQNLKRSSFEEQEEIPTSKKRSESKSDASEKPKRLKTLKKDLPVLLNLVTAYLLFVLGIAAIAIQVILIVNTGELYYIGAGIISGFFDIFLVVMTLILGKNFMKDKFR